MFKPRETITSMFSEFISWTENERFRQWDKDSALERSQNQQLNRHPEYDHQAWANYWHRQWLSIYQQWDVDSRHNPDGKTPQPAQLKRPQDHLIAYLQEVCYWSIINKLEDYSEHLSGKVIETFDDLILGIPKVLIRYKPDKIESNFIAYAQDRLGKGVLDMLRYRNKKLGSTQWGRVIRTSRKKRRDSLSQYGMIHQQLEEHLLLWQTFKDIYDAHKVIIDNKCQPPSQAVWERIRDAVNKHLSAAVAVEDVQNQIFICLAALEQYQTPKYEPLLRIDPSTQQEIEDHLTDYTYRPEIRYGSLTANYDDIQQWLRVELLAFYNAERTTPTTREIARLYFRPEQTAPEQEPKWRTQDQIGERLGIHQATVGRRTKKLVERMCTKLIHFANNTLHKDLDCDDIDHMESTVERWIRDIYETDNAFE